MKKSTRQGRSLLVFLLAAQRLASSATWKTLAESAPPSSAEIHDTKDIKTADSSEAETATSSCKADNGEEGECVADNSISSVYVIGDLHGDAICAISWVNRTGLISNLLPSSLDADVPLFEQLNAPSDWQWSTSSDNRDNANSAKLVFMGDYVDKGPTSKQTVEFVRNLTLKFPDRITAILGNHELELLRDRDERIPPFQRYSSYAHATVHPGEYHNYFHNKETSDLVSGKEGDGKDTEKDNEKDPSSQPSIRSLDPKDDLVLDLLYEASMEVYTYQAHNAVRYIPSLPSHLKESIAQQIGIHYAITDIIPPQHRVLAMERLQEYQDAYLDAYRSESVLGKWMETQPVIHYNQDVKTLFVHGGVSFDVASKHLTKGKEDVDTLNAIWWEHSGEGRLFDFLTGKGMSLGDSRGHALYELLTYRGNHPGYAKWENHGTVDDNAAEDETCIMLDMILNEMEGVDRIAVGHTPDWGVRILCGGKFLALDSMLGRWIRGSGNEYCPGPEHIEKRKKEGVEVHLTSRDGKYRCDEIKEVCEGQIVRLDSDGSVNVLTM